MPQIIPAPMAGYTDRAFRRVLRKCGAKVTFTEMISVTALYHGNKKTLNMLKHDGLTVVQLFGKNPEHFKHVIKSGILNSFTEININMGCPARKIVNNGEGCALMQDPVQARLIIETCVRATKKPISVKCRLGYEIDMSVTFARMCRDAGASRIYMHGRLGEAGYSGKADWEALCYVVHALDIPVIVNGDIRDIESLELCLEDTGAESFMMGRALIGAPWKCNPKYLTKKPDEKAIKNIIKYHLKQSKKLHGEGSIFEMRKHLLAYCTHLTNGRELKLKMCQCKSFAEAKALLN